MGWRHHTGNAKDTIKFRPINRDIPRTLVPPWNQPNVEITSVKLERKKEQYSKEELKSRTEEQIDKIKADIQIYTDGSTSGKQANGGAGVTVVDDKGNTLYELSKPAGALSSSYDAECVAMLAAIDWIKKYNSEHQTQQIKSKVILTDSESLVQAITKNNRKEKHEWMKRIKLELGKLKHQVNICWIPSHCGIQGNERADKMAEIGSKMDQKDAPVT